MIRIVSDKSFTWWTVITCDKSMITGVVYVVDSNKGVIIGLVNVVDSDNM